LDDKWVSNRGDVINTLLLAFCVKTSDCSAILRHAIRHEVLAVSDRTIVCVNISRGKSEKIITAIE